MSTFFSDLRFGFRIFVKHPGFSLLAIFALGLGIHLVANQLFVINAFLFRGLPAVDAERIVDISHDAEHSEKYSGVFHPADLAEIQRRQQSLEALGGFLEGTVNVSDGRNPRRYDGAFISWDFMNILGLKPERGRAFTAADSAPGAAPVLILSHRAWQRDFNGDPLVLGRRISINAQPGTIVGVMPEGVHFPAIQDAWTPLRDDVLLHEDEPMFLRAFGRLRSAGDLETARVELNEIAQSLAAGTPERWKNFKAVEAGLFHRGYLRQFDVSVLWVMLVAVLLVLAIACANVANLLLARSTARCRELAVRSAVGATRPRLILQMLTESLALCLAGGTIGVLSTAWTAGWINRWFENAGLPYWIRAEMDPAVIGVVFLLTVFCACAAGIVPALRASRSAVMELLNESCRTSTNLRVGWFGRTVIGLQVAMAFALLILAGMMIRAIGDLGNVELPYPPPAVLSARFGLFDAEAGAVRDRGKFLEELTAKLDAAPLVQSSAITTRQQFDPAYHVAVSAGAEAAGSDAAGQFALFEGVSNGYFRTLDAAIVRGREFNAEDVPAERKVAIVNESFVRRFFPDADPIGAEVLIKDKIPSTRTIVGVVQDLEMNGVDLEIRDPAGLYIPLPPEDERFFTVILRAASGDATQLEPVLRRIVREMDADLPLYWVRTYREAIETALAPVTVVAAMFLVFGAAAVVLASIGIYGVVSFTVSQRTPEIGIRMALGAGSSSILAIIVRQGAMQLAGGLLAGSVLAVALATVIRQFGAVIGAGDITLFALVGVVLAGVVLLASFLPAKRAVQLTPLNAMRHD